MPKHIGWLQIALLKTSSTTIIGAVAIIALALGCVEYQSKPISLKDSAAVFDHRSLTNRDLQAFIAANLTNPPTSFSDWTTDSLTLAAIFYHPSLEIARAQRQTAVAGKLTANGRPNPTLSLSPGYNFSAVSPANPWIPGASIEIPIETAGKRQRRAFQAQQVAIAAQHSFDAAAAQIRSNVLAAAIEVWSARKREALITNQITHQSALLRLLEQRVSAGAMAANELLFFQVAQLRLQSDLAAARTSLIQAKAHLSEAIGMPAANFPDLRLNRNAIRVDPEITSKAADLRMAALQQRADILAALARYEAAQGALQLEIAKQYPDVRIGPGYQWDQGEHKWNMLLSVELPLLNQNRGPIAEAEGRRRERAAEVIDIQARAIHEIDRAMATAAAAHEEQARIDDTLGMLEKQTNAVRERLALGAADQTELETAAVEQAAAAVAGFDAEVRALAAEAQLETVLQRAYVVPGEINVLAAQ